MPFYQLIRRPCRCGELTFNNQLAQGNIRQNCQICRQTSGELQIFSNLRLRQIKKLEK